MNNRNLYYSSLEYNYIEKNDQTGVDTNISRTVHSTDTTKKSESLSNIFEIQKSENNSRATDIRKS